MEGDVSRRPRSAPATRRRSVVDIAMADMVEDILLSNAVRRASVQSAVTAPTREWRAPSTVVAADRVFLVPAVLRSCLVAPPAVAAAFAISADCGEARRFRQLSCL